MCAIWQAASNQPCDAKPGAEAQQRFVGKLGHFEHGAAAQPVSLRQHGQNVHWIEQPAAEAILAGRHDGDVEIAAFKAARQAGSAVLYEMDVDAGVTLAVAGQEIREQILDHLRGGANPKHSDLSTS